MMIMAGADSVGPDHSQQTIKTIPKDALVMASILKEMGVNEYEPRVINQMLEFSYRYVTDVLEDSRVYSLHASRKQIDIDDVVLAVERKLDHSFTSPPPREFLLEAARTKNSQPLPLVQEKSGLRLPPDRYCVTGSNYRLKAGSVNQRKIQSSTQRMNVAAGGQKLSSSVSQGASSKAGIVPGNVNFATLRQGSVGLHNQGTTQETMEQRNNILKTNQGQLAFKDKSLNLNSEKHDTSSTVGSLPSMEETAASAHSQALPHLNLLKRKREGEDCIFDS